MKKTLIAFILLIMVSCKSHPDEVIVIEKTKSYHTEDCNKVMMAKTKTMKREEALSMNCKPCTNCQPDRLTTGK